MTKFRRLAQPMIEGDARHDPMPGYAFAINDDVVDMAIKPVAPARTALA